jgi:hypothetical protein
MGLTPSPSQRARATDSSNCSLRRVIAALASENSSPTRAISADRMPTGRGIAPVIWYGSALAIVDLQQPVIFSDATGTNRALLLYWANQATGLVNDVPGVIMPLGCPGQGEIAMIARPKTISAPQRLAHLPSGISCAAGVADLHCRGSTSC